MAGLSYFYSRFFKLSTFAPFNRSLVKLIVPVTLMKVSSHFFGTIALAHSPVSLVHTIKSLSPLFIVAFYWIFHRARYSKQTIISLCILIFGVALVCFRAASLTIVGFIYSILGCLTGVGCTVCNKQLLSHGRSVISTTVTAAKSPHESSQSKLSILFHISVLSMTMMLLRFWLFSGEISFMYTNTLGNKYRRTMLLIPVNHRGRYIDWVVC